MKEYRKGYEQEMEERLESYKKGGKSVKYAIGILIGFYLVYKFPIEKDVENAMRGQMKSLVR